MRDVFLIFNKNLPEQYLSDLVAILRGIFFDVHSLYPIPYISKDMLFNTSTLPLSFGLDLCEYCILVLNKSFIKEEWTHLKAILRDDETLRLKSKIVILSYDESFHNPPYELREITRFYVPSVKHIKVHIGISMDEMLRFLFHSKLGAPPPAAPAPEETSAEFKELKELEEKLAAEVEKVASKETLAKVEEEAEEELLGEFNGLAGEGTEAQAEKEEAAPVEAPVLERQVEKRPEKFLKIEEDKARRMKSMKQEISVGRRIIGRLSKVKANQLAEKIISEKPRNLQFKINEKGKKTEKYLLKYLKPNSAYVLTLRIGWPDPDFINADQIFIDDILKEYPYEVRSTGERGHTLRLIFYELFNDNPPREDEIFLPEEGNSNEARFEIYSPPNRADYQARVILMYQNRTLQTAIFSAPISREGVVSGFGFKLTVEASITQNLRDIDKRPNFDACLIFNHNEQGETEMVGVTKKGAARIQLDGSSVFIRSLNKLLEEYTTTSHIHSFCDKETHDLLLNLAQPGNSLYDHASVVLGDLLDQIPANKPGYKTPKRIQVIESPSGTYFPVEFFYGRHAPQDKAEVCLNAEQGLASGKCSSQCPADKKEREVICPFAFWGLSVEIERHKSDKDQALSSDECIIDFKEILPKVNIQPFKNALFAASNKVDEVTPGSISKMLALIRSLVENCEAAETWDDLEKKVENTSPDILVLVVHTCKDKGVPAMEIGDGKLMLHSWIEESLLKAPGSDRRPMVLLIGCSTAFSEIPFQSFIPRLQRKGAVAVLATVTSISGSLVPSFMEVLMPELKAACARGGTFSNAVLRTRQKALAKGQPLAVVLASYGDAELLL